MKNLLILLSAVAVVASAPAQDNTKVNATQPVVTQPVVPTMNREIPRGWAIAELKDQTFDSDPIELPNGQKIVLTIPKYVLQPSASDDGATHLFMLEPGFDPNAPSGNPREKTLLNQLLAEMEALRVESLNIQAIGSQLERGIYIASHPNQKLPAQNEVAPISTPATVESPKAQTSGEERDQPTPRPSPKGKRRAG